MKIDSLLRAHRFMRVERPPELWGASAEDVRLIPLIGEMIAVVGLSRGNPLAELTLNAANVVVESESICGAPIGEYVALSVKGKGDWRPEWTWRPGASLPKGAYSDIDGRIATAAPPSRIRDTSATGVR